MEKKLYLVRHGQTVFNKKDMVQGWCDSRLTPYGHEQAKAAGKWLKEHGAEYDYVICSDLPRTEETLKEITDLPYERKAGIRERSYGRLEGDANWTGHYIRDHYGNDFSLVGGESQEQLETRMFETLKEAMEREDSQNVLAVAHGDCMLTFAKYVDPEETDRKFRFANCVIYIFGYEDGKFRLLDMVDEHVRNLKEPDDFFHAPQAAKTA